jgi:protease-4
MAVGDQPKSIYAEPTTTTGSIGVIIPHYDLTGLMDKYGVKDDSIATHERKQMLSMTRSLTPEHREILKAYIGESFDRFKDIVKEGRPHFKKDDAALNQLATGEVFTAAQAQRSGLVDEIGFIEAAIDRALEMAALDKASTRVVKFNEPLKLFDFGGLMQAPSGQVRIDVGAILELNTPRAYYLSTTLPVLVTSRP